MSHWYAEIQGSRGEASRMGTVQSGMWGHIRGWHVGAQVEMYTDGDGDRAAVYATSGSAGGERNAIGSVHNVDGSLVLTPSAWALAQVEAYKRRERNQARKEARKRAKTAARNHRAWLRQAWQFFHANAGGWVGHSAETAIDLARAEMFLNDGIERGTCRVAWHADDDADTSWMGADTQARAEREGWTFEGVSLEIKQDNDEWETVESLWGIVGATDDYRRVIVAELACSAFTPELVKSWNTEQMGGN